MKAHDASRSPRLRTCAYAAACMTAILARPAVAQSKVVPASDADRIYTGEADGQWFGVAVAGIGDIHGTSPNDPDEAAIVAVHHPVHGHNAKVYVAHKSTSLPPYYYQLLAGGQTSELLRQGAAACADYDGDQVRDFIVGGDVTTVFSGADGGILAEFLTEHEDHGFGHAVASADMNDDGYDDVIVGASRYSPEEPECTGLYFQRGRVYVFFSPGEPVVGPVAPTPAEDADIIFTGNCGDWLGSDVATGDLNGDGLDDLVMGAWYAPRDLDPTYIGFGRAYVYLTCPDVPTPVEFGGLTGLLDDDVHVVVQQREQPRWFGWSVLSGGDISGDGGDDLVIGSYRQTVDGVDSGMAFIFYSDDLPAFCADHCDPACEGSYPIHLDAHLDSQVRIGGVQAPLPRGGGDTSVSFAYELAFADINDDGRDELIVSAPFLDEGASSEFGACCLDEDTCVELPGDVCASYGGNPQPGSDCDNAECPGDPGPEYKEDVGAVFVFDGTRFGANLPLELTSDDAIVRIEGENAQDLFGYSISNHGRADYGNNRDDLIMGAPNFGEARGRAYVLFPPF